MSSTEIAEILKERGVSVSVAAVSNVVQGRVRHSAFALDIALVRQELLEREVAKTREILGLYSQNARGGKRDQLR
jgi:hypothetical protein